MVDSRTHAKSWQVETSRMRVFSGIFETKMPRGPAKIADFGIVLPSGVKEWLSRVSSRTAHKGDQNGFYAKRLVVLGAGTFTNCFLKCPVQFSILLGGLLSALVSRWPVSGGA
jgi:hypothetical protein